MNFLVMTLGSIGDFFPYLAVAEGLRQRGHRVVLASNAGYAGLAQMAGFEFAALWDRSSQSLDGIIAQDPARAWAAVHDEMFLPAIEPSRKCIAYYTREGQWTLLASWSVFAAAEAHDLTGVPLRKIYLSAGGLQSDREARLDNAGLRNIGLFPGWFADAGLTQTGFAMLDDTAVPPLSDELEAFLRAGSRPVIFTPGSFMRGADAFFREALAACNALHLRAIFLTPYRDQVPQDLPPHARHFKYAPLQRLAPRAAALAHHGGIGTLAQGLKAGIPQLVSPLFFDQPDNAAHLAALSVSATLPPQFWQADAVAEKLHALLHSATVKLSCAGAAARFAGDNAVGRTCDIILSLAG
ncbi:MAG TPA: nucleotide disphospho-sugar-binding domain-containing protein [Rhizomicrobium sp.]|jgi:UDP:flavonoid glycosyltransferase YjiC (YdhE family)